MGGYQLESGVLNPFFLELAKILQPFDCVPFFGTLLGLARGGSLITGDDDIDFVCDLKNIEMVTQELQSAFSVLRVQDTLAPASGAGTRTLVVDSGKALIHVDLYIPIEVSGVYFFPCHWFDSRDKAEGWLKVPISMIESIRLEDFAALGKPLSSLAPLSEYLYGPDWQTPSRKNIDHIHSIVGGIPVVRGTSFRERLMGTSRLFYSNFYWVVKSLFLGRANRKTSRIRLRSSDQ